MIDSVSWALNRPPHHGDTTGYTFEWHFANENWLFYEGEALDARF